MDYYPYGVAHSVNNLNLNRYLFGGKELQDASLGGSMLGYYDFGARFYNPLYGRWFNMDPARQFLNPFTYCGNNPVVFIDPDGREVYVSGDEAEAIVWQLQQWMGDMLILAWDKETGLLSYTLDEEKKLKGDALLMTQMIDSKSIRVNVLANNTEATSANTLMIGGSFMGTNVTMDDKGNVKLVEAKQEVNPRVLGRADAHTNTTGKMAMHELSESYQAGLISQKSGKSSPRAGLDGSVYEEAHDMATPQTPVYETWYDENNQETKNKKQTVRIIWSVENNMGEKKPIQYQKISR